jgi:hypothetical protein
MPWKRILVSVVLIPIVLVAAWTALTLNFSYARGERAGYLQKFSQRGWMFKTWEGELAMANLPGSMPEIFYFTVRDPQAIDQVRQAMGQRVSLTYNQHRGIPFRAFGETEYFVTAVTPLAASTPPPQPPTSR